MADTDDNVVLKDGSDADFTAATDYVGGKHYPVAKMAYGEDGTATWVSGTDPFPVEVLNGSPIEVEVSNANANGQATMANSAPVVLASNHTDLPTVNGADEYEAVAAGQTDQVIGATGATGDYLSHVLVIPGTTSPGAVTIKDGTTTIISYAGGTVASTIPFVIPVGVKSVNGAWKITTGSNVTCLAVGDFT